MRFHFASTNRPKTVAKKLRAALAEVNITVSLGEAQKLAARLYGYQDWQELTQAAGKETPSRDDAECDAVTIAARRRQQIEVLSEVAGREAAESIIEALHPTSAHEGGDVTWQIFEGGFVTRTPDFVYWAAPASDLFPDPIAQALDDSANPPSGYEVRSALHRVGEPLRAEAFYIKLDRAETVDGAKDRIVAIIAKRRQQKQEEARLGRHELDMTNEPYWDTRWGERDDSDIVWYADGLLRTGTGGHGGYRVSKELVATMPPVLRGPLDEDGFAWYEEDCEWALLALGLPQFFTTGELASAKKSAKSTYPRIMDILEGKTAATPEAIRKAQRGFAEEKIDWAIMYRGPIRENGLVPVYSHMNSYWGTREIEYEEFGKLHGFLVPINELEEKDFYLDPERYQRIDLSGQDEEKILASATMIDPDSLLPF